MQREVDPVGSVQWQPGAAPKTACVMQAVLVSAAIAVMFQALVNAFTDIPAIVLHVGSFLAVLPMVWAWQQRARGSHQSDPVFSWVSFGLQGVQGQLRDSGKLVGLQVVEVSRFFGALQLRLRPVDATIDSALDARAGRSVAVIVWRSAVDKDKFRRLSVLAIWHARRCA